jgi:hypothetical protein
MHFYKINSGKKPMDNYISIYGGEMFTKNSDDTIFVGVKKKMMCKIYYVKENLVDILGILKRDGINEFN